MDTKPSHPKYSYLLSLGEVEHDFLEIELESFTSENGVSWILVATAQRQWPRDRGWDFGAESWDMVVRVTLPGELESSYFPLKWVYLGGSELETEVYWDYSQPQTLRYELDLFVSQMLAKRWKTLSRLKIRSSIEQHLRNMSVAHTDTLYKNNRDTLSWLKLKLKVVSNLPESAAKVALDMIEQAEQEGQLLKDLTFEEVAHFAISATS